MKKLKIKIKEHKAITLIALAITIVVLIILAAVAINLSLGNNGIFNRAKTAKEQYQNAESYEQTEVAKATNQIDTHTGKEVISSRYTNLGAESEVLWTGDIVEKNATTSWTKSIEDYSYLILQTRWSNENAKMDWLIDVPTIKEDGYYPTNYSDKNSHMLMSMYANYYCYVSFTSDKSLILPYINGSNVHLVKIIGIK